MSETTSTDGVTRQKADGIDSDPTPETEFYALTAFQRDVLTAIAVADDAPYGLAIKQTLGRWYSEEINHGRLYPNLDELAARGHVTKTERDGRTNEYRLTRRGKATLAAGADAMVLGVVEGNGAGEMR